MNKTFLQFAALALSAVILLPASASQAANMNDERVTKLIAFFKMNVAADTFREVCDPENKLNLDIRYDANVKAVDHALMKELMVVREQEDSSKAQLDVARRRQVLSKAARQHFQKEGCDSPKAQAALEHLSKMTKPKVSQILEYLRNIENQ